MGKKPCRVLVVEDQAAISMLIEDMLLDAGLEVIGPAATLDHAFALARDAEVDAAVLDINVRGEVTYPVADLLCGRGVPVIFATGYGSSALPERFKSTPTLHKPFDEQSFTRAIEAALTNAPCDV